jgi:hypothetical protein
MIFFVLHLCWKLWNVLLFKIIDIFLDHLCRCQRLSECRSSREGSLESVSSRHSFDYSIRKVLTKNMVVGMLGPVRVKVRALTFQRICAWSSNDARTSNESLRLNSVGKLRKRGVLSCDMSDALVLRSEQVGTLTRDHSVPMGSRHFDEARNVLLNWRESSHWGRVRGSVFPLALVNKISVEFDSTDFLELNARQLLKISFRQLASSLQFRLASGSQGRTILRGFVAYVYWENSVHLHYCG